MCGVSGDGLVAELGKMAAEVTTVAIAMAIAGRNARACDVCANKSAHWFCAADDAYLCTGCDSQVHCANALSMRHERVRLSANGTPMKASAKVFSKGSKVPKVPKVEEHVCSGAAKKLHASPPQVAPVRKRSRTARPYSHHLKKLTLVVKVEDRQSDLEIFDVLDGDDFLVRDDNQEVPCLLESSSSELDFLSPDGEFQEGDHSASADSFAAFFKSKAAHSHGASDDGDQFLVPDATAASSENLPGDAFFFPGDIPGLGGFDSFVPEVDLSDDFSMSFDLALQNNEAEAFEGEHHGVALTACKVEDQSQPEQFTDGPFAKFFTTKSKAELMQPMSLDRIASQAREILSCCRDEGDLHAPALKLNVTDVLAAWSDRGDFWIRPKSEENSKSSSDAGVVPDLDAPSAGDDSHSGADRDARVLRYKEKRRTRLFSKKIRYEVRKLNAERRPRMKGRFVKRSSVPLVAAVAAS